MKRAGSIVRVRTDAGVPILLGSIVTTVVVLALTRTDIPQLSLLVIIALVGVIVYDPQRIMLLAFFTTPFIGGLRRVVSGDSGRVESDFLILIPYVLVAEALIMEFVPTRARGVGARRSRLVGVATVAIALSGVASVLLSRALGTDTVFRLVSEVLVMTVAWAVAARGDDGFWDKVRKVLPKVALVPAIYGVLQFVVLPEWDRRWMLAVADTFTSIGAPQPFEVRVFGLSESPGSYAAFLALAIVVGLVNATTSRGARSVVEWLTVLALVPALLLSGVRAALLMVLICVVVLVLFRTRGRQRVLLVAFVVAASAGIQFVVSRYGGSSSILTDDRYSLSNLGTDTSLQARGQLLSTLADWYAYVIGAPKPFALDNYFINVMVQYGLVAALALALVLSTALVKAIGVLARSSSSTTLVSAALATVLTFAGAFAGDPSYALMAMIQFAAIGTVIGTEAAQAQPSTHSRTAGRNRAGRNAFALARHA